MMNIRIIYVIFTVAILSGCGTVYKSTTSPAHQTEQVQNASSANTTEKKIILNPEGSKPKETFAASKTTPVTSSAKEIRPREPLLPVFKEEVTRPEIRFTTSESEHVRIGKFEPLSVNGLIIDLDELKSEFTYPYMGKKISEYGIRRGRAHTGVDIKTIPRDTIRAALDGVVRLSKMYSSYGNVIVIRHYNGIETVYSHGAGLLVKPNDVVRSGEPIMLAGRTGRATTEHLHFEVRVNGEPIDPNLFIDCTNMTLNSGLFIAKPFQGSVVAYNKPSIEDYLRDTSAQKPDVATQPSTATDSAQNQPYDQQVVEAPTSKPEVVNTPAPVHKTKPSVHTVKSGDTLSSIARRYSTNVDRLCKLNGISKTAILRLGQKIKLP